jgi:diguanylate cyclase (GGDEF)-like protein/PAS domain S-box-containing protein
MSEPPSGLGRLFEESAEPAGPAGKGSPWRLFTITAAAVFLGEVLVMLVLSLDRSMTPLAAALLDGALVTALLIPVLYLLLVRPLGQRIRELSYLREELGRSRGAYRSLIDSTEDSIYLVDDRGRYQFVNRHHASRLGRPTSAIVGGSYADFHSVDKSAEFAEIIAAVIREGRSSRQEYWSPRDERYFLRTFTPVTNPGGVTVAVTVVSKDITDLKRFEQQLQELSVTDELTGLQNRRGFETLAAHRLKVAERQGVGATLLYADLDNLKQINDARGHQAGDRAIRDIASILGECCRESDIVARVGGDEFVVLLTGAAALGVEKVVGRIQEAIARHNAAAAPGQRLGLSVGHASCVPGESCTAAALLSRADRAMYAAKSRNKASGASEIPPPLL